MVPGTVGAPESHWVPDHSVSTEPPTTLGDGYVRGQDGAAFTCGDRLDRVEGESSHIGQRSHPPPVIGGSHGVCRVRQQDEPPPPGGGGRGGATAGGGP